MLEEIAIRYSSINAFYIERIDPLFGIALSYVEPQRLQAAYLESQMFLFGIGMFLLLRVLGSETVVAGLVSAFTLISTIYVVGLDPFLLKTFYFPLLLFSAVLVLRNATAVHVLLFSICGLLWVTSATSLAFFGLLLIFAVEHFFAGDLRASEKGRQLLVGLVVFFLGLAVVVMPDQSVASYPAGVQLGPDTVFAALPAPFWGDYQSVNPISFDDVRSVVQSGCLRLGIIFLLVISIAVVSGRAVLVPISVCLLACFSLFAPEAISGVSNFGLMPFHALRRTIPGLWFVDNVVPAMTFGLVFAGGFLGRSSSKLPIALAFFVVFLVALLEKRNLLLPEVLAQRVSEEEHFNLQLSKDVEFSPSAFVVKHFGDWILSEGLASTRTFQSMQRLVPGRDFEWEVSASTNPESVKNAIDNKDHTRWSTGRAQKKGDFFQLNFDRKVKLTRLLLSVYKFPSDFPNSFKFQMKTDEGWKILQSYEEWYGPVAWTIEGYPYFDSRSKVILDLPETVETTALRVELLRDSPHFDWTVAEAKLYR